MIRPAIFVLCSLPVVWLSRDCLLHPGKHGFYRFFAFEAIIALLLLQIPGWFHDPFSPVHCISWVLLTGSAFLAIHGFWLLKRLGKPKGKIEDTTQLVVVGAYRYIRHPLYGSLLYLAWGAFLKSVTVATTGLALVATLALLLTATVEERENIRRMGPQYAEYRKHTKRFIPYIF